MDDLLLKLKDLNRKDEMWEYTIQILPTGGFILHGVAPSETHHLVPTRKRVECESVQELREEMYRIILNLQA